MQEWSIIKGIVESQNSAQLRESESQKYLKQLEDGYKTDFEGFKDHFKRFIKLVVKEHYVELENQKKDLKVHKKKGLENLLFWRKPKTSQEKPEKVDWDAVETQISDANVLSNETISIALSYVEKSYESAYGIAEMIPFKLGIITQKSDFKSKLFNETYYKNIFKKFLKNLQFADLDSLEKNYVKIRVSEKYVGYNHIQEVEQIVERNIKKRILDDLAKEDRLNPHIQGSRIHLSLQNNGLDFEVIYDHSSGKIEIEIQGHTDLESCRGYFGNLTVNYSKSLYAGRRFNLSYNKEFSNFIQEAEKERIKTAIDEYRSEESPEQSIERFNLNDEQTREMEARLQPLYDKLNSVQTEIKYAESEFIQPSTPHFSLTLEKKETLSKNIGNYITEVILNSDGNKIDVNGRYVNIDSKNIRMLNHLFT